VSSGPYQSWGRIDFGPQTGVRFDQRLSSLPDVETGKSMLPYGNGRSYGDSCLNTGGVLIDCRQLDRFISFDPESGVLRCEAGVLLADILDMAVPRGWFLPVSPGTRLVTVGGAIANDVHGKNHHRAGTFGCHVRSFESTISKPPLAGSA
jgi:FAD/FMN-containing dehydrogenase